MTADSIRRNAYCGLRCGGCSQAQPHLKDGTAYRPTRPTELDKIKNLYAEVCPGPVIPGAAVGLRADGEGLGRRAATPSCRHTVTSKRGRDYDRWRTSSRRTSSRTLSPAFDKGEEPSVVALAEPLANGSAVCWGDGLRVGGHHCVRGGTDA